MEMRVITAGSIVRHFKGNMYQVLCIATHSETKEKMVVYQALYGDYGVYVRPYEMFWEPVDRTKYPSVSQKYRFEIVDRKELLADKEEKLSKAAASVGQTYNGEYSRNDRKDKTASDDYDEAAAASGVNPVLLRFLDAENPADKAKVIDEYYNDITESVLNSMEASLDIAGSNGSLDDRLEYIRSYLKTRSKYENLRLRR